MWVWWGAPAGFSRYDFLNDRSPSSPVLSDLLRGWYFFLIILTTEKLNRVRALEKSQFFENQTKLRFFSVQIEHWNVSTYIFETKNARDLKSSPLWFLSTKRWDKGGRNFFYVRAKNHRFRLLFFEESQSSCDKCDEWTGLIMSRGSKFPPSRTLIAVLASSKKCAANPYPQSMIDSFGNKWSIDV